MFNREDWPGFVFLGICSIVAIALLIEIFTGYSFTYTGPNWLGNAIGIVGFGLVLVLSWKAWGSRIKRWRGKGDSNWPQNNPTRRSFRQPKDDDTQHPNDSTR